MPAGTDLVTWAPRVGETGDDRYAWPEDASVYAGPSDIYSDPPTLDEVNAGSGLNQMVAEFKRRVRPSSTYVSTYHLSTSLEYFSPEKRLTQDDLLNLWSRAWRVSSQDGIVFTPISSFYLDRAIPALSLQNIRQALQIDHFVIHQLLSDFSGNRTTNEVRRAGPTYPPTAETTLTSSNRCGQAYQSFPKAYARYRPNFIFRLPSDLPTINNAKLEMHITQLSYPFPSVVVQLFRSNSFLGVLDTGDFGNLDNLEDEVTLSPPNAAYFLLDVDPDYTVADANLTYIAASKDDANSIAPTSLNEVVHIKQSLEVRPVLRLYT